MQKEIEEREFIEAQLLLQEARSRKKGKKPILEGVSEQVFSHSIMF